VPEQEKKKKDKKGKSDSKKDDNEENDDSVGVGSIAAGGRYDELVGMFSGTNKKGATNQIPCVGVSIGVERVFSVLSRKQSGVLKSNSTQVYVMAVGDGLLVERMALAKMLWEAGIQTEFMYKSKPKLQAQFNVCDKEVIPFAVIIGPDEVEQGLVKIKDMRAKVEGEGSSGVLIPRDQLIATLKEKLSEA
jgi:histidyl-tRNA synthetase